MLAASFPTIVITILSFFTIYIKLTYFSGVFFASWTCKEYLLCASYSSKSLT